MGFVGVGGMIGGGGRIRRKADPQKEEMKA